MRRAPWFCGALLGELRSLWSAGRRPEVTDLLEPGISARLATLGAAVAAAAVLEVMLGGVRDVARVFTALAADGVLLFGCLVWDRHRAVSAAHRVFVPVAIARSIHRIAGLERPRRLELRSVLASARGLVVTRTVQVLALLALVCLSPFLSYVGRVHPAAAVPAPVRQGAAFSSWESLGRLWVLSRADELPTLADFVAHEAYQSGLSYGGEYRLPSRDEQLMLSVVRSRNPGPGVVAESRTVLQYSDRWLRETLGRAKLGSVGGLLAAQGRAARVSVAVDSIDPVHRPEFWKIIVYSAMVTVLLVMGSHYLGPSLFLGSGRPWIIRRRQQEA
jgi:hypothetical protein